METYAKATECAAEDTELEYVSKDLEYAIEFSKERAGVPDSRV